jgi:hypothetical protein
MYRVFDNGTTLYKIGKLRDKIVLLRATPLESSLSIPTKGNWTIVQISSSEIESQRLAHINAFFGTQFESSQEAVKKSALESIFYHGNYRYRVIPQLGKLVLQRSLVDRTDPREQPNTDEDHFRTIKYYNKMNIREYTDNWENLHTGDKIHFHIDEDILKEINRFFNTNFSRYFGP